MDIELNLAVDVSDKVADVLNAAVIAYHASAVELAASWHDRKIPLIWAEIAGELDIAAWKIAKIVRERLDPRHSPRKNSPLTPVGSRWRGSRPRSTLAPLEIRQ